MYKILILQRYYHLSDDQTEFQINDRLSFQKFLGITLSDKVPDAKSIGKNKNKLEQKDTDARWTKKNQETHYGYKNHVKADSKSRLIEDYTVTPANTHDSQAMESLVENDDKKIWADSAYTGAAIEETLDEKIKNNHRQSPKIKTPPTPSFQEGVFRGGLNFIFTNHRAG